MRPRDCRLLAGAPREPEAARAHRGVMLSRPGHSNRPALTARAPPQVHPAAGLRVEDHRIQPRAVSPSQSGRQDVAHQVLPVQSASSRPSPMPLDGPPQSNEPACSRRCSQVSVSFYSAPLEPTRTHTHTACREDTHGVTRLNKSASRRPAERAAREATRPYEAKRRPP